MDQLQNKFQYLVDLEIDKWNTLSEDNGIITQEINVGQALTCGRAYGIISGQFDNIVQSVWDIYTDIESMLKLDPDVIEFEVMQNFDEDTRLIRHVNKLPWPMWPREFVYIQHRVYVNPDTAYIYMYSCDGHPENPDKYVRGNICISAFSFKNSELGIFVYRSGLIDPCGNIPVSIVNMYRSKAADNLRYIASIV